MARQETSPFILFIGEHRLIYCTLFINELKGGTLGNVPMIVFFPELIYTAKNEERNKKRELNA